MRKKISLFLFVICICSCLTGCTHKHDTIEIYNKSDWKDDNIFIHTKDGYFYDRHEKFTVDDNTIAITIYFSNLEEGDTWDRKSE